MILRRIWERLYYYIATLRWSVLLIVFFTHGWISYALMLLAGEMVITGSPATFLYYYVTTATTVGYGDLSPEGIVGRLVAALFLLPGSIALFGAALGKAINDIGSRWRLRLQGKGTFEGRSGHMVIVGWQPGVTRQLITKLLADKRHAERPVLIAPSLEENPMPDDVDFIAADKLSDHTSYDRAGAATADTILVRGRNDDDTLAATLAARGAAPDVYIVCHFEDRVAADLIDKQVEGVEVFSSVSTDMMVRAAHDPGASKLARLMFSSETESTAFSFSVPDTAAPMAYVDLMVALKRVMRVTLIGVCEEGGARMELNCKPDRIIGPGNVLFYIADDRREPTAEQWQSITGAAP